MGAPVGRGVMEPMGSAPTLLSKVLPLVAPRIQPQTGRDASHLSLRMPGAPRSLSRACHVPPRSHPRALVWCLGFFSWGGLGVGRGSGMDPCVQEQRQVWAVQTWHRFICTEHVNCICGEKRKKKRGLLWLVWFFPHICSPCASSKKSQNEQTKPEQG